MEELSKRLGMWELDFGRDVKRKMRKRDEWSGREMELIVKFGCFCVMILDLFLTLSSVGTDNKQLAIYFNICCERNFVLCFQTLTNVFISHFI